MGVNLGETITISAMFKKTSMERNGWRICMFQLVDDNNEKLPDCLIGKMNFGMFTGKGIITPNYEGEVFELTGEWCTYARTGEIQFKIDYGVPCLPTTDGGQFNFIRKAVKGLPSAVINRLISKADGDLENLSDDYIVLAGSTQGLSDRRAKKLIAAIKETSASVALTRLLKSAVNPELIKRLLAEYGPDAYEKLKEDPYSCVKALGFDTTDKIALSMDFQPRKPERIKAAIMAAITELRNKNCAIIVHKQGHFILTSSLLEKNVPHPTEKSRAVPDDLINNAIYELKQERVIGATKGDSGYLYFREDFDMERELASKLFELGTAEISEDEAVAFTSAFDEWTEEHPDIHLHPNQAAAVCAASHLFSVVTGGPGTGKTTVLKAIMETYKKVYPDKPIVLMAPTGLAAKRMTESCERPAKTIHKALGLVPADNPSGFSDANANAIDGGLIIIDEFSMVGIHLCNFLIDAVQRLPGTHIVFVGDVEQLPSVSPGTVLQDLINCGKIPVTRLTKNYRQASGSMIADCAVKINTGDSRNLKFEKDCLFQPCNEADIADRLLEEFKRSTEEFGFDQTYIITPTHRSEKDPLSSNSLNKRLQELMNPQNGHEQVQHGSKIFRVGDRVINKRNAADVINGDIGVIKEFVEDDSGTGLRIEFTNDVVDFAAERLKDLELAYAITVHSSQGCEFKSVIMPISTSHRFMLTRNLTYTAVTRAKKKMLLVGNMDAMVASCNNVKTGDPSDLLYNRIAAMQ